MSIGQTLVRTRPPPESTDCAVRIQFVFVRAIRIRLTLHVGGHDPPLLSCLLSIVRRSRLSASPARS